MPGAFDGDSKRALVLGAVACDTAGQYLASLRDIARAIFCYLFVINHVYLIGAERTHAFFSAATSFLNHLANPPIWC
jgi:hypothetical protein